MEITFLSCKPKAGFKKKCYQIKETKPFEQIVNKVLTSKLIGHFQHCRQHNTWPVFSKQRDSIKVLADHFLLL